VVVRGGGEVEAGEMLRTWASTVLGLRNRRWQMAWLERPSARGRAWTGSFHLRWEWMASRRVGDLPSP
jgi:hypothetical protein